VLTTGEEPPVTEPAPPADIVAVASVAAAGSSVMSMSWRTRVIVAVFVALAVGVVGTGVVVVRRALNQSVDPQALAAASTARLDALAPSIPGLKAQGPDTAAVVDCGQLICAEAARMFTPAPRTTAAALAAAVDVWATQSGLGNKNRAGQTEVSCGSLGYAPTTVLTCDVATYDVPGQSGQHVHLYAQIAPGPGAGGQPGTFPIAALGRRVVTAVYLQVLSSAASS